MNLISLKGIFHVFLGVLGIPFLDVVRVLAAVLLLGNVQFVDGQGLEVDVHGEVELKAVASLLGIPSPALFRGLTSRTHNARGQLVKSVCDANMVLIFYLNRLNYTIQQRYFIICFCFVFFLKK